MFAMRIFAYAILVLSLFSPVAAIATGSRVRNLLWYYAIISLALDVPITWYMLHREQQDWLSNLFLVSEFLIVGLYLVIQVIQPRYRIIAYLTIWIGALLYAIDTTRRSMFILNLEGAAMLYFVFIILTLVGLYKVIKEIPVIQVERSPIFIICSGVLLYAAGNILIMQFSSRIDKDDHVLMTRLWTLHNVLNVVKNIAVSYCLFLIQRHRLSK